MERLEISSTYLPLMYETHLTPLAVIQGLLPLFRIAVNRQGLGHKQKQCIGSTSIIILVPAVASRVGVAFDGARAMAVAGMVKGAEVLRREVGEHVNVLLIDVGSVVSSETEDTASSTKGSEKELDIIGLTRAWSASEKREYGPAYEAALVHAASNSNSSGSRSKRLKKAHHSRRRPTDIDTLVSTIVPLIHVYRGHARSLWNPAEVFKHFSRRWLRMTLYLRGYRISIGAGARTYTFASLLPAWFLNSILRIPTTLIGWKDKLAHPTSHPRTPERESATSKHIADRRTAHGKMSTRLIEGDAVMSTAPASTASGDSRRESVGSFEGVSGEVEEDLVNVGEQTDGHSPSDSGHLDPGELHPQSDQPTRNPLAMAGNTDTIGSSLPHPQIQNTAPFEEPGDKIGESWVSVRDS